MRPALGFRLSASGSLQRVRLISLTSMGRIRIPVLVVLFTTAAVLESVRLSALSAIANSDVWWHLSSGTWMLQNHALPRSGLFSQSAGAPWIAASWAYDLLLASGFKLLGLSSIPMLLMIFKTTLAMATFLLGGGLRRRFWRAVALSVIAQYVLGSVQPGPAYFSILFFAIELLLLLESRRRQRLRMLFWLPGLFLLWANLDIQFVAGIGLLLLFLAVVASEKYFFSSGHSLAVKDVAKITGLSVVCTLITPYFYRAYGVFFGTTFSSANLYLPDFHAPGFRQPQDYVLLLLAMTAFLVLGLRRSRDLFAIALLGGCIAASFYSQRNIWLVTMAAVAVIGQAVDQPTESETATRLQWKNQVAIAVGLCVAVLAIAAATLIPRSHEALMAKVGQNYPVAACDLIREQHLARPLFNAYEWGGFVTWYLPQYPVAIDGRNDLYGADAIAEYSKMMSAEVPYTEYAAVSGAQTILLPKRAIMAGALSSLPLFKVAYSDDLAVVLRRNAGSE